MNLIEKVKAAIERENLIPDNTKVIVGVSGGADSVALLHILHRLDYPLVAAHLNHSIRDVEADADEQFVKDLCAKLGVECVTAKTDVPALAAEKGISLEMAARQARHDFFRSVTSDLRFLTPVVCLAHHADDQLETFFLRAARGTGPSGLGGMRSFQCLETNVDAVSSPRSPESADAVRTPRLRLIRPMLGIRRAEILQWLESQGIEWREDASNADETIPRNRVRHQILPRLRQGFGGQAMPYRDENILRTMELLRDENDYLEKIAAAVKPEELSKHPKAIQRRVALRWLIDKGVTPTFDAVEQFIEFSARTDGTTFLDLEGVRLVNEYGKLKVGQASCLFRQPGRLSYSKKIRMEQSRGILRGRWKASVSMAKIDGREVMVRTPQPGDRMKPYGMEGSKKLQDIFTDLKIPQQQRAEWPVVECGGEIIWIPGYRIARGWELASDDEPALHLFCEA